MVKEMISDGTGNAVELEGEGDGDTLEVSLVRFSVNIYLNYFICLFLFEDVCVLFFVVTVWVWHQWDRWQGGVGAGHLWCCVRWERPQQPGQDRHQRNSWERQQVGWSLALSTINYTLHVIYTVMCGCENMIFRYFMFGLVVLQMVNPDFLLTLLFALFISGTPSHCTRRLPSTNTLNTGTLFSIWAQFLKMDTLKSSWSKCLEVCL